MLNANVGKKAMIPLSTSSSASDKIAHQARETAKAASFTPHASTAAPASKEKGRGRPKSTGPKSKLKGIYFDAVVFKELEDMQEKGQNVSKYVNRLVRQALSI
jgi:hypothetical protein